MGIETATALCGVALTRDDELIASYQLIRGFSHAEKLPGAIEKVLEDAGLTPDGIDAIAVSIGPGSFTGLRIGLGVAKGMSLALSKPVVAVPTLDVLVEGLPVELKKAGACLYARKGEVFLAFYETVQGCWQQQSSIQTVTIDQLDTVFREQVYVVGDGVTRNDEAFSKIRHCHSLAPGFHIPNPYCVAKLGSVILMKEGPSNVDQLVPLYFKRFQGIA